MSDENFENEEEREDQTGSEPVDSSGETPDPAAPDTPDPAEYVEPPTEELFAFEARVEEGDVPDLDPVFRAALLESTESAIPEPPGEEPSGDGPEPAATTPAAEASAAPTDSGEDGVPATGDFEATGEHPVTGTQDWEAPSETGITAEQTAVLQATARSQAHEAIDYARRTGKPWDPPRPPVGGDFDQPAKRRHYWWRFLLAIVLISGSFATATQASVMHIVNDLADRISADDSLGGIGEGILPDSNGGPQTIAILGSDVRTGGGAAEDDPGRSDTAILLRLDPDSGQIAMLSIPRDLYVEIPGIGYDKFNAAYSYGGVKLTLQTMKQLTGLEINKVVNVDFQGFADVIDAVGCVYADVDRYYFNDNSQGGEEYATIDIEAGYQKLCGYDALDFARYRHTDSDLVRAARQQDLIGEIRNRLSLGEVIKRRNELLDAFADNTTSNIDGGDEVLELLKLLVDSRGANVTEVSFPSTFTMRDGISFVEATPEEVEAAVNQFLGFEDEAGSVGDLDDGDGAGNQAKKKVEQAQKKKAKRQKEDEMSTTDIPSKEEDGLVDAAEGGLDLAIQLDDEITRTDFPVFYTKRLPEGTIYETDQSRVYHTRDPDKNVYGAYRMVMSLQLDDGVHYFGLQGIRGWTDPPILEAPNEEIEMDDRTFRVFPEGDRIRLISWTEDDNVYWISNSLLLTLENQQMLGMARSTRAFTPDK